MLIVTLLISFGTSLTSGLSLYYYIYIIKDISVMSKAALISFAGILPGIILSRILIPKIGIKKVVTISILFMAVFLAVRIIDPMSIPLIYVSTVFLYFGLGFFAPVAPILSAENIDYIEYKLDMRSEASVNSISAFVSKFASGFGVALP